MGRAPDPFAVAGGGTESGCAGVESRFSRGDAGARERGGWGGREEEGFVPDTYKGTGTRPTMSRTTLSASSRLGT